MPGDDREGADEVGSECAIASGGIDRANVMSPSKFENIGVRAFARGGARL